jgi:hypothetical protein
MRNHDILLARSPDERRALAQALGAPGADIDDLVAWMRSPDVRAPVRRICHSPLLLEDLTLLCANPFDPVRQGEVSDAALFARFALLHPTGPGAWAVNLDLALALLPVMPLEFGFAATLIARLSSTAQTELARMLEISPRPNPTDFLLDLAEACRTPARVGNQLARLHGRDRQIIREALAAGELPDDPAKIPPGAAPPTVSLDASPAGARGLVFRVDHPALGLAQRPCVALELQPSLAALMDRVPEPPEVVAARAAPKRTRRTTIPRARTTNTEAVRTPTPSHDFVTLANQPPPSFRRIDEPHRPSATGRSAHVQAIAGVVDLEEPRIAEAVLRDPELRGAVLEIVAETLAVIRAGFHLQEWAETAAARFHFHYDPDA